MTDKRKKTERRIVIRCVLYAVERVVSQRSSDGRVMGFSRLYTKRANLLTSVVF